MAGDVEVGRGFAEMVIVLRQGSEDELTLKLKQRIPERGRASSTAARRGECADVVLDGDKTPEELKN